MNAKAVGPVQIAVILLTIATALIHLWLGVSFGMTLFILNGIGYLGLVTALYLPQLRPYQKWVRWALIAFTAVTVLAWVFIGQRSTIGYLDKLIEVALIVFLFIDSRA
jgi:hypothetical protein